MFSSHRHRPVQPLVVLFFAVLTGTGSASAQSAPEFELLHFWAEDIELHALSAFSKPMREAGVEWKQHVISSNFVGIRETFSKRLAHDAPPTASFWIGGGPDVAELIKLGIFRYIAPSPHKTRFAEQLLPEVYEAVKYNDGLSVLPVGIHIQNFIVYSRTVLDEVGEPAPESWEAFLRVAEKAKRAGYTPLSISDQAWQLRYLIGSIMAEYLSVDDMMTLASDNQFHDAQREAIRSSFQILTRLKPYLNADFHDLNWKLSFDHVVQGRAMANILGDFVAPLTFGHEEKLLCALPPGNNYVTWSFDSIVLTNTDNPSEMRGQKLFADIVMAAENSANYFSRKGGVPITKDFDSSSLPACPKVSVTEWQQSSTRIQLNTHEWTRSMSLIASYARDYLHDSDIDIDLMMGNLFKELDFLVSDDTTNK